MKNIWGNIHLIKFCHWKRDRNYLLFLGIILDLLYSANLQARNKSIPLMPPRMGASYVYYSAKQKTFRPEWKGGFEVGVLGRKNNTNQDMLGLNILRGIRLTGTYQFKANWMLKGSFGFFRKTDGASKAEVTQNQFEAGITTYWISQASKEFLFLVGFAQRVDGTFSRITAFSDSESSPIHFRYRIGPSLGIDFNVGSENTFFITNLEYTTPIAWPLYPYVTFTTGILFRL